MLYLLTPTDNRPEAFGLLERWIGAQDFPDPFRWVVGTRDASPYEFHVGQIVVERPDVQGLHPLCSNLIACLEIIDPSPSDLIVAIEDDDFYAPGYLSRISALADGISLAGQSHARYYHVGARRWHQHRNSRHASLCQTAFRADVIPRLREICERGNPKIDLALWREWGGTKRMEPTEDHVGIKGMPGQRGIGIGHRESFGTDDYALAKFHEWGIPDVYAAYAWRGAPR